MDSERDGIPPGKGLSRTPVSSSGPLKMNAAATFSAAAAVQQGPVIEGTGELTGPAPQVAQGSEGKGGDNPGTPVLPQSGTLHLTAKIEELLSKIKTRCGQNRVLWEDVFKNKLLTQEFLEAQYDEDILFLPTLGCPDMSVEELNELAVWCSSASRNLEVLAGTSFENAVEVSKKL